MKRRRRSAIATGHCPFGQVKRKTPPTGMSEVSLGRFSGVCRRERHRSMLLMILEHLETIGGWRVIRPCRPPTAPFHPKDGLSCAQSWGRFGLDLFLTEPYFCGLPRLAKNNPRISAALRNMPAFFRASAFSGRGASRGPSQEPQWL
jgi:hypothetical protein